MEQQVPQSIDKQSFTRNAVLIGMAAGGNLVRVASECPEKSVAGCIFSGTAMCLLQGLVKAGF